jgi:Protein of unknown function (DUF3568)
MIPTDGRSGGLCQRHTVAMADLLPRWMLLGACATTLAFLPGCAAVAVSAAGVGMATGVSHTLGGIVYKTFAAPEPKVRRSTVAALGKMQIKIVDSTRDGNKETIKAQASDRDIEIVIETLTPKTTRMTVTASIEGSLLRDSATATEIILQTEKLVGTA